MGAERTFQRYQQPSKYSDFQKILDKETKTVNAVIVATPDHMHAATMAAIERGKHVYT